MGGLAIWMFAAVQVSVNPKGVLVKSTTPGNRLAMVRVAVEIPLLPIVAELKDLVIVKGVVTINVADAGLVLVTPTPVFTALAGISFT